MFELSYKNSAYKANSEVEQLLAEMGETRHGLIHHIQSPSLSLPSIMIQPSSAETKKKEKKKKNENSLKCRKMLPRK